MKEKIEQKLKNGPKGLVFMTILFILVFLVGSGGGLAAGFYWGKNKKAQVEGQKTEQPAKETAQQENTTPIDKTGEITYTVQPGDTLFTIGLKFNLPWTEIAQTNGLAEDSVIKAGQILKIPGKSPGESKEFTIDQAEAAKIQTEVDGGKLSWYLDPVAVAKAQVPSTYSISENDEFSLKSKNTAEGMAIVEVVHDTKVYQIELVQPIKKDPNGIWFTKSVSRI